MKLIDKNVIADIKYVPIKTPLSYGQIRKYLQVNRAQIDKLALDNGIYITCNNIICNAQNYLIFNILSMNELDFHHMIKQVNFADNFSSDNNGTIEHGNDFNKFINELNGIEMTTIQDDTLFSSFSEELNNLQEADFLDYLIYQNKPASNSMLKTSDDLLNKDFKADEYVFVGKIFESINNRDWLKNTIMLNIIKNYLGDNDTDSIYFNMKEQGHIYSGLSMTFPEKNILLTGCFLAYQKASINTVNEYITSGLNKLCDDPEAFENAKNKFVNMFKIINLEYHSGNLLETYNRYLNKPMDFSTIKEYVNKINIEDIRSFIEHLSSSETVLSLEGSK